MPLRIGWIFTRGVSLCRCPSRPSRVGQFECLGDGLVIRHRLSDGRDDVEPGCLGGRVPKVVFREIRMKGAEPRDASRDVLLDQSGLRDTRLFGLSLGLALLFLLLPGRHRLILESLLLLHVLNAIVEILLAGIIEIDRWLTDTRSGSP